MSIVAHALVVGGVLLFSGNKPPEKELEREIVFQDAKPPPIKGTPGGPPKAEQPKTPKPPKPKRNVPILTNEPPKPAEPTREPEPSEAAPSEQEGPGNGGDPNGSEYGVPGGTGPVTPEPPPPPPPEPPPQNQVLSFGADMERPVLIGGPAHPEYPNEAKQARVEAVVIARCVITTEGSLRDCQIIKGHPFLNPAVEATLAKQRYRPVLYGGKPINVRYTLNFNFRLQ
jgi:protein TonB